MTRAELCPYGDPHCPCPDGAACHYEWSGTTPPWPHPKKLRTREGCPYCEKYGHEDMMPWHTPSVHCESGRRAHCTCDVCF